jgi:hypothetical protein
MSGQALRGNAAMGANPLVIAAASAASLATLSLDLTDDDVLLAGPRIRRSRCT